VAGRGTRFVLQVPLTLTTLRAVLATAGGQVFAFPGTNVAGLMRVTPEDLRSVGGRRTLVFAGVATALLPLAEVLGLPRTPAPHGPQLPAVLVAAGEKQVAFLVDEVLAEQEITVKRLPDRVHSGRTLLSGATILPSGRVALVLNLAPLVASAVAGASGNRVVPFLPAPADVVRKRILLVDDSITTRTLVKTVLEAAGYDVTAAADGHLAWTLLQEAGADMIVSDVEMPRMDGIALTESVRASDRFRELPVVLVTGRENEWDRARGMKAGADAYLLKSAFDQERFLATIAQLLGSDG
jgi:two-component system chemotaxis sensor kinase CheA